MKRMHGVRALITVILGTTVAAAACDRGDDTPLPPPTSVGPTVMVFDTATVTFHTGGRSIPMRVEVAERHEQRAYGLMDRDSLAQDAGMIFLYGGIQDGNTSFWMYRTRIPLDIAYIDGAGRIAAIVPMTPCPSADPARCPPYAAGAAYFSAIEVNRGWFARNGIGVGDRVTLP